MSHITCHKCVRGLEQAWQGRSVVVPMPLEPFFNRLPPELLVMVFDSLVLHPKVLGRTCLVCSEWRRWVQHSHAWMLHFHGRKIDIIHTRERGYCIVVFTRTQQRNDFPQPVVAVQHASQLSEYKKTMLFKKFRLFWQVDTHAMDWFHQFVWTGNLSALQLLHRTHTFTLVDIRNNNNRAILFACISGHLKILKWLHLTYKLTKKDINGKCDRAFYAGCSHGYLTLLKWMCETFSLNLSNIDKSVAMNMVCRKGHKDVFEWMIQKFSWTHDNIRTAYNIASRHSQTLFATWLKKKHASMVDETFGFWCCHL